MALFRSHATKSTQSSWSFEFCTVAGSAGLQFPNHPNRAGLEQDDKLVCRSNEGANPCKQRRSQSFTPKCSIQANVLSASRLK